MAAFKNTGGTFEKKGREKRMWWLSWEAKVLSLSFIKRRLILGQTFVILRSYFPNFVAAKRSSPFCKIP